MAISTSTPIIGREDDPGFSGRVDRHRTLEVCRCPDVGQWEQIGRRHRAAFNGNRFPRAYCHALSAPEATENGLSGRDRLPVDHCKTLILADFYANSATIACGLIDDDPCVFPGTRVWNGHDVTFCPLRYHRFTVIARGWSPSFFIGKPKPFDQLLVYLGGVYKSYPV